MHVRKQQSSLRYSLSTSSNVPIFSLSISNTPTALDLSCGWKIGTTISDFDRFEQAFQTKQKKIFDWITN